MRYNDMSESAGDMLARVKAMLPSNTNDIQYQAVKNTVGNIVVSWSLTFRRDTHMGAYQEYSRQIDGANYALKALGGNFPGAVLSQKLLTSAEADKMDTWAEDNGNNPYSEYEQSMGGSITLKSDEVRKTPKDGRKEHLDIAQQLSKLNGKTIGKVAKIVVADDGESVVLLWKLEFTGMKSSAAYEKHKEVVAKAEELLQKALKKFNDQALNVNRFDPLRNKELDRYMNAQDIKGTNSLTGSVSFLKVLPSRENGFGHVIADNHARKAALAK